MASQRMLRNANPRLRHRKPKWVPHYGAQADSGRAQALLRLCSGSALAYSPSAQVYSPSAQVKAAVAHVRRLKRNQRKGKLILSLGVLVPLLNYILQSFDHSQLRPARTTSPAPSQHDQSSPSATPVSSSQQEKAPKFHMPLRHCATANTPRLQ